MFGKPLFYSILAGFNQKQYLHFVIAGTPILTNSYWRILVFFVPYLQGFVIRKTPTKTPNLILAPSENTNKITYTYIYFLVTLVTTFKILAITEIQADY